ncbi:MAG: GNAT family N-acetyltransferase [Flavobacteriales bacterium]|nr:GNAT family N-acetyltransferase [Flavobacteriales bacterium]MDP4952460.1 GNAT family N-acetyltransferase [Flavobacteriales bacterium]
MSYLLPNQEEHLDRSGKHVIVRPAAPEDAEDLIKLKKRYINGSDTIPLLVSEYLNTVEQEAALISQLNSSDNSLLLLAEQHGKLIGNIDLIGSARSRMDHTAMLGVGLLLEARNRGIGSILMNQAIEWAKYNPKLKLVWLDTYSSNLVGLTLYDKMGFKVAGVVPGFFEQNGQSHSKVQMYLKV